MQVSYYQTLTPQCENYSNFDDFDLAYQNWLDDCDDEEFDEASIMSSSDIWQQYQEGLNNES